MVFDLSAFRNIEEFNFKKLRKQWRQQYRYREAKRPFQEGLAEQYYDVWDPSDPNLVTGEFTDVQQARDAYLIWARAWLSPWTADENGGAGVAISHEEVVLVDEYGYLMGIRFRLLGGPYQRQVYRFMASRPERIGFLVEAYAHFVTSTKAEEDALPQTIAAWWTAFQADRIANGKSPLYGDFELVGAPYVSETF